MCVCIGFSTSYDLSLRSAIVRSTLFVASGAQRRQASGSLTATPLPPDMVTDAKPDARLGSLGSACYSPHTATSSPSRFYASAHSHPNGMTDSELMKMLTEALDDFDEPGSSGNTRAACGAAASSSPLIAFSAFSPAPPERHNDCLQQSDSTSASSRLTDSGSQQPASRHSSTALESL